MRKRKGLLSVYKDFNSCVTFILAKADPAFNPYEVGKTKTYPVMD